jgi:hypothetical protein
VSSSLAMHKIFRTMLDGITTPPEVKWHHFNIPT